MNGGGQSAHRADGSDVENDSLPLANHLLVDRFGNREKTVHIRVNHFIPGAVGGRGEVVTAINGGVVDEDVDAAPLLHQFAGHFFHADAVDDGDLRVEGTVSVSFNFAVHLSGEVVTTVVAESHVGAFAGKDLADGRTNAARSTGDKRAFSLKQKAH